MDSSIIKFAPATVTVVREIFHKKHISKHTRDGSVCVAKVGWFLNQMAVMKSCERQQLIGPIDCGLQLVHEICNCKAVSTQDTTHNIDHTYLDMHPLGYE